MLSGYVEMRVMGEILEKNPVLWVQKRSTGHVLEALASQCTFYTAMFPQPELVKSELGLTDNGITLQKILREYASIRCSNRAELGTFQDIWRIELLTC